MASRGFSPYLAALIQLAALSFLPSVSFGLPPVEVARLLALDGSEVQGPVSISGRTLVIVSGGVGHVFVQPDGGWVGDVVEAARLRRSDGGRISGPVVGEDVIVATEPRPSTGPRPVWVFVMPRGGWQGEITEQAKLFASDPGAHPEFPNVLAVREDTIVASAYGDDDSLEPFGAAYVFVKPRKGWAGSSYEDAKLMLRNPIRPHDDQGTYFSGIALNDEAVFVAVPYDRGHAGAVYAFPRPSAGWHGVVFEGSKLTPSDSQDEDHFGVSLSAWGRTLVVTAIGYERDQKPPAYVFVAPPGGWASALHEQARLVPTDDRRLEVIAISRDTVVGVDPWSQAPGIPRLTHVFVEPPNGWSGEILGHSSAAARIPDWTVSADLLIQQNRILVLGLDTDHDGLSDALEEKLRTDPVDADTDHDGIADGRDPDWIGDRVQSLSDHVLVNRGARHALLKKLRAIERRISAADLEHADTATIRLRHRFDGCGAEPDRNDWIRECATQRELRELLEVFVENLRQ